MWVNGLSEDGNYYGKKLSGGVVVGLQNGAQRPLFTVFPPTRDMSGLCDHQDTAEGMVCNFQD